MTRLSVKDNFQFKGFKPNKEIKQRTRFFYNLIESRSPSDSKKIASLTKKGELYEARLKISSASHCSFEISSKTNKVSDSVKSLEKNFLIKLSIGIKQEIKSTFKKIFNAF